MARDRPGNPRCPPGTSAPWRRRQQAEARAQVADVARHARRAITMAATSHCCHADTYIDDVDGGTYCTICDREVDAKTGRALTEDERLRRLCQQELAR